MLYYSSKHVPPTVPYHSVRTKLTLIGRKLSGQNFLVAAVNRVTGAQFFLQKNNVPSIIYHLSNRAFTQVKELVIQLFALKPKATEYGRVQPMPRELFWYAATYVITGRPDPHNIMHMYSILPSTFS